MTNLTDQELQALREQEKNLGIYDGVDQRDPRDYELRIESGEATLETSYGTFTAKDVWLKLDGQRQDIRYKQRDYTGGCCTCTIIGASIRASNYLWYELQSKEIESIIQFATTKWYVIGRGRASASWNSTVAKRFNNNTQHDLMYSTIKLVNDGEWTETFLTCLDKWLLVGVSHETFIDMWYDTVDGVLNGTEFERQSWAHSTNIAKREDGYYIVWSWQIEDYKLEGWLDQFKELIDNKVFRNRWYIMVSAENKPQDPELQEAVEWLVDKWLTKQTSEQYLDGGKNPVTREHMALFLKRMYDLNDRSRD